MKPTNNISEISPIEENKPEAVRRVNCGMTFPESGKPFYYCVVADKIIDKTKSLEDQEPIIEIIKEGQAQTIGGIEKEFKKFDKLRCKDIYVESKKEYWGYIKEINRWKAEESADIRFKTTKSTSFESSIMTIKEFVVDKRIVFPDDSIVKSQLSIFSSGSLKQEEDFYAVKSLCLVIHCFKKQITGEKEKTPSFKSWY
jgi:hypothetical protein